MESLPARLHLDYLFLFYPFLQVKEEKVKYENREDIYDENHNKTASINKKHRKQEKNNVCHQRFGKGFKPKRIKYFRFIFFFRENDRTNATNEQ